MAIFTKQNLLSRVPFNTEKPFEKEVFQNHELFFGKKTILIDAKIRLEGEFANTIPDGYLFDFSNEDEPVLYMVEIEIEKHDFHNHILPQMAKFGAVFKSDLQSKIKFATTLSKFIRKEENKKIKDEEKRLKDLEENKQREEEQKLKEEEHKLEYEKKKLNETAQKLKDLEAHHGRG